MCSTADDQLHIYNKDIRIGQAGEDYLSPESALNHARSMYGQSLGGFRFPAAEARLSCQGTLPPHSLSGRLPV